MSRGRCMLAAALIAILLCRLANAAVTTTAEPRQVEEMDNVYLTLRVDGAASTEPLDLAPLEADFEVLGNNTQSQYRSVNGEVQAWVEYQISLRPRRTGELVIPSLKVGNDQSDPVRVIVRPMDPAVKQTIDRMIFFESELTANPVYVQGETVLKRRLYYSNGVQIYSDLPGPPEIPNAVVIPLGDTQSRSTLRNGQRYGIIEQQFAIFPEQSGELLIPPISITSSIRLQDGTRIRRSGTRISTQELRLEVMPIPAEYPRDKPWLPARDVRIAETWSPNQTSTKVGEPLHRSLAVTVIGNTGSAIPPLGIEFSDDHFKWYPEAPTLADDNSGHGVIGSRIESYSLIPIKPGPAPLDEVGLTWWDTDAQRVRVARLPRSVLTITGNPIAHEPAPDEQPKAGPVGTAGDDSDHADASGDEPAIPPFPLTRGLLVAALALLVAGLAFAAGRRFNGPATRRPAADVERHPRNTWSNLQDACRTNDAAVMRTALLAFIEAHSDDRGPDALKQFIAIEGNEDLWRRLNQVVYGQGDVESVSGAEIIQAAARLRKCRGKTPIDPLPALYS